MEDSSGEAAFLEDAVERWGDTVLGLAVRRTGNRADAEDVFQTVFLRLHQSKKHFRDAEHLKAWLLHAVESAVREDTTKHAEQRTIDRDTTTARSTTATQDAASAKRPTRRPPHTGARPAAPSVLTRCG